MRQLDLLTANDPTGDYPASWYAETAAASPPFSPLEGAVTADVCVIGGGYTGLSAALHLARAGFDVRLLEAARVGWGASGRNGGQVGSSQRRDQDWLEAAVGVARAHALWRLAQEARALVSELIARHAIACDLRPGVLYAHHRRAYVAESAAYAERLARDYGYESITSLDARETAEALGTEAFHGGALDRGAAHLHPLNFALGLARAASAAGVHIHEASRVTSIGPPVRAARGEVRARYVLVACNGYLGDLVPAVAARVMPINNFIVATEPLAPELAAPLLRGDIAAADSRFVVNYWRMTPDRRLLFGGGESYGYRFPRDIAAVVGPRMRAIYPQLRETRITHAWGGTLAITRSRMPAFQRLGSNVFSAAGYSGHGVAMATLAGKLMAEAVRGGAERFDIFAGIPALPFPGGASLRAPLLALAMTWYALRDRL
ncbi:MAG: FAD-binding oxidoreductase [Amaricoccus sp.]|uniref:NAD(P)/FAD-dependent oxidoreductase n=1 Tax=Amaricoccus sp. TaxID=1872485 RepID=UPI0033148887